MKSGAKNSKYSVYGSSFDICSSTRRDVSYVQHLATLRSVYPPPPTTKVGTFKLLTNFTHSPCPFVLNEKHPSLKTINFVSKFELNKVVQHSPKRWRQRPIIYLSFANESAPHCKTIAVGWKNSITFEITGLKTIQ